MAHSLRGFSPWSPDSILSGPVMRQSTMEEKAWQHKHAHPWQPGSREGGKEGGREREREEGGREEQGTL